MPERDKDRDKNLDQGKPAADLLRRSLASGAGAPGPDIDPCPDPEILAAYFEHSLDADETARYELHFSRCARCREMLAAMVHAGEPAGTAGEKRARTPGAAWIWDWRWLAPATAALIFVVIFVVFRPSHPQSEQRLVAMNQPAAPRVAPPADSTAKPESAPPESSRAAGHTASGVPSATGALDRTATNLDSAKPEIAPPAKSAPPSRDETKEFASNIPLAGRNYEQLDTVKKSAAAPKTESSGLGGNGVRHGEGNGVGIPSTSQTVTVEASTAPITPAPSPAAAPAPPEISTGDAADAPAPAAKRARQATSEQETQVVTETAQNKQTVASLSAANRNFSTSESVMVQSADDRSARTLVRSPDPDVLWRISSGRFVERSKDAGATWRVQWTNANAHVVAGAAPSIDTCWLVGSNGIILLTTDGKKWKTVTPPAEADFADVTATDASSATVTTTDDRKFTTSDGGKRWAPAP